MKAGRISEKAPSERSSTILTVTLSPVFKLVFLSVLGITGLSMVVGCSLVGLGIQTQEGKALFDLCVTTWKLGFGAIIGLLGGKTI
jgi:hypothetical protein